MKIRDKLSGAFFLAVCFLPQSLFACNLSHGFKLATERLEYERVEAIDVREQRSTNAGFWKILYNDNNNIIAILLEDNNESLSRITRYAKFQGGLALNIYTFQFPTAYNVNPAEPSTDYAVVCGDQTYFGTPLNDGWRPSIEFEQRDVKGEYESIKDLVDVISRSKEIQPFLKKLLVQ
jgi:hypothetical protein